MDKSITSYSGGGKIANIIETGGLALPFENTIYLQSVRVAGMKYYVKDGFILLEGDKIKLKREPANVYDKYAIELFAAKGEKIGYIPAKTNKIFARLMDGGKMLTSEVRTVDYYFEKLQEVWIRIFLNDL
ncbi:HIRAN domain-containing protein [Clostridium sp.]|uniref:HIRAN domain-containing protein n=1 Tax=Clostridium sp. TaxID=1506 RepID=UPI003216C974